VNVLVFIFVCDTIVNTTLYKRGFEMRKSLFIFIVLSMILFLVSCTGNTLKISFHSNGGSAIESIVYNEGETPDFPEDPTRLGYVFSGWYFDETELSEPAYFSIWQQYNIKGDVNLYAKWDLVHYTITYELITGMSNHPENPLTYTIEDAFLFKEATKDGHSFISWTTDVEGVHVVSGITKGTTGDIKLYPQTQSEDYDLIFLNYDGSVLANYQVMYGVEATYLGDTPVKPSTETESYVFVGWTPSLTVVTADVTYTALFEAVPIQTNNLYDPTALNQIFGYDIYKTMPSFETSDVLLLDYSEGNFREVYIDIFDWSEADADAYIALLDANYAWDDLEESWILGDYFIFVYEDDVTYQGKIVYGIGIYGEIESEEEPTNSFNPNELNDLFGFNIYALIPSITSDDALILDYSDGTFKEVYVDLFDWSEADIDAYIALLDLSLVWDDLEESWILGDYYIYAYADDQSYPGMIVYGIGIYGEQSDTEEPVQSLYIQFNVQDTLTTLTTSYKDNVNKTLDFSNTQGKVLVTASYLANITGSAPAGLSTGIIFASDVSNTPNALAYLEIHTLGTIIDTMTFVIEARDSFNTRLLGAKLQVFNGSAWTDLPGGDFYSQLSTNAQTITISGINATHFRLIFPGSGSTSNGGQFMISSVQLYVAEEEVIYPTWDAMLQDLTAQLNVTSLADVLVELEGLSQITLTKFEPKQFVIMGDFVYENYEALLDAYLTNVFALGYVLDSELSELAGGNVYTLKLTDDLAYGITLYADGQMAMIVFYQYDPVIEKIELQTLGYQQSINEFEVATFGMSGLPSTGSYDVLVIPVEISGFPFPSDYLTKLNLVFNGSSIATGWESVASFYFKSSYGLLDLNFVIANKFITANSKTYYENYGDDGDQYAIKEALLGLDATIDFSNYDSNNDGLIDSVIFIYSVDYNYDVNPWWAWVFSAQYGEAANTTLDGKDFEYYMWASYYFLDDDLPGSNPAANAETYIHELGHLMGLIDYYSFTYDYGPLGGFDMMDYNAGDHGPASKLILGWLQPYLAVNGSYEVTLESFALDSDGIGSAIVIPYHSSNFTDGDAFDEFLIIMFYTPEGLYDAHLAANYVLEQAGLVIYHVDARLYPGAGFWDGYFMYNNDGGSDFFIDLLEVDKNNSLPGGQNFKVSDMLTSGSVNLSTYTWHQGGQMNITIELTQSVSTTDDQVTFVLYVN
jgi:M6 family metalloprotease-like protein/uncharacterized repeat protein (TIGR02543 family)